MSAGAQPSISCSIEDERTAPSSCSPRPRAAKSCSGSQPAPANRPAPDVSLPTARAFGVAALEIIVDSHERYPWKFSHQQLTTTRRALAAGDYAVERDGQILASVERKSLADLVATMTGGRLWYLLADLASLDRAAVAVEDRYSQVFKLDRVRPAVIADALAEAPSATRWCRSCSARPARWPRNGPTASSAPP